VKALAVFNGKKKSLNSYQDLSRFQKTAGQVQGLDKKTETPGFTTQ